ncbi:hypothetical protein B0I37DRAFT_435782 [Chaetomium sp. MPI-CAGE-AT-0009]|nr:hypothetical protein B0I37DRAFT_435782 [Chaetomium sp. MPI-CAGE-AT-0009]
MSRIKQVCINSGFRSRSDSVHGYRPLDEIETAKASTPKESVLVDASLCDTVPGVRGSKATFIIQPQDSVQISEKLRPFVVTVTNPPDSRRESLPPYRATVTIYYNNSALEVVDPSPVVEHTDCPIPSAQQSSPKNDGTVRNMHFIFEDVKIDYVGEYTMHASIFRPDDDIEGPAFLTTPWSTLVKVVPPSRRVEPTQPTELKRLVAADLCLELDLGHANPLRTHPTEDEPTEGIRTAGE